MQAKNLAIPTVTRVSTCNQISEYGTVLFTTIVFRSLISPVLNFTKITNNIVPLCPTHGLPDIHCSLAQSGRA